MAKGPALYTIRVDVEPDDITHERAKDQLACKLGDAVEEGMQINGIREPVYGLDDNGNKVIVAYEALVWTYGERLAAARARKVRDQDLGLFLNESGVAIPL